MANDDDKDILITPNVGATGFPNIQFKGYNADTDGDAITLNVLNDNTLSFESNQGQVFSINPILNTGTIFSVNDISGIASISVNADGTVAIAETGSPGKLGIGTTSPMNVMQVNVGTSSGAADGNNGMMIVNNDASLAADALIGGIGFDSVDGNVPSSVLESSAYVAAYAAEDHGTGDKGGHIAFGTAAINQDDDTVSSERMRITSEGLVGIGTNAPSFTSGTGLEISDATQANLRVTDSNGASTDFATSGNDTYILNRHASGKIYIKPGNGDHSIELASNGQVKFNNAYTFPTSDGSNGQVLQTNGSGALSFASVSSGGGASTLNDLTDVLISNDSFIVNNMGSAPTTGTLSSALNNIAIGDAAMDALTQGDNNVAFGDNALGALTTGTSNIAIGLDSLQAVVSASSNVGIGQGAGTYVTGDANVAIGLSAMAGASSGTISAANNVAIGENTMAFITTGIQNVAIGDDAGIAVTTGNYNVLIGSDAGDSLQTGHENILIGRDAGQNITSGSDNVIIGGVDADSATGSDQLKIASGDGGVTWLAGSSAGAITFNGAYTFPTSDGSNGQVLQTNGSGTLSFASVSGGSGISDLVDDTSPQLGGDLDTNSRNIKFDDAHGIYDDSNNEMLVFEKTASADSYIEVHNAITNSTSATLFGNDVVGSNIGSAPTSVGPGFAATGTNDNVALAFKTKGLGNFIFMNDDTTDNSSPTLSLMRKHSSEADNDNIGQILFKGMDSSPTGSDVEDLRDYAKVRARMIDVTDGTADGQMRLSALVANSHKTLMEVGVHEDDDNAAGVSLWRGQMRDIGSNTTLDEGDYAGRYLRVTGAYTVTLPASPAKGEQYIIISDHSGTTTISANGSDTMNGSTNNQTITTRYEAKTCIAVSTSAWIVLG